MTTDNGAGGDELRQAAHVVRDLDPLLALDFTRLADQLDRVLPGARFPLGSRAARALADAILAGAWMPTRPEPQPGSRTISGLLLATAETVLHDGSTGPVDAPTRATVLRLRALACDIAAEEEPAEAAEKTEQAARLRQFADRIEQTGDVTLPAPTT